MIYNTKGGGVTLIGADEAKKSAKEAINRISSGEIDWTALMIMSDISMKKTLLYIQDPQASRETHICYLRNVIWLEAVKADGMILPSFTTYHPVRPFCLARVF